MYRPPNQQPTTIMLIQAVLRYLAVRQRSTKEIEDYLHKRNCADEDFQTVMTYVIEHKLVDDEVFAKAWAISRIHHGKGDRLIALELTQKGVSKSNAQMAIAEISREEWYQSMQAVLTKQKTKWISLEGYQQRAKKYQLLLQRGFSSTRIDAFLVDGVE
jgi:regulatory protein